MKELLKPRDKYRQKMSKDGLLRENMTTGETENISAKTRENSQPDNVISEEITQGLPLPRKKELSRSFKGISKNPIRRRIVWIRQGIKSQRKRAFHLSVSLMKDPAKEKRGFTLKKRKSP